MRVQDGGIHRFSQDHQRIHFGLAGNTSVESLTVKIDKTLDNRYTPPPSKQKQR